MSIRGESNRIVAALTVPFLQRLRVPTSMEDTEALLLRISSEISEAVGAGPIKISRKV